MSSIYSILNTQNLIPSTDPNIDTGKTAEEIAREDAEEQRIDFLNLLLTQLSNQNPLDPMDTDEWTAQLTRYSILEQGIETNEKLAIQNDLLKNSAQTDTFNFIGKEVEIETNIAAVQNGQAVWSYLIEGSPKDVTLTVTDEAGNRLAESDGSVAAGVQTIAFDASNLKEGQQLYLSVNPTDGDGNNLNSRITSRLIVDGVWSDGQQNYLTAGEISFRQSDVLKLVNDDGQSYTPPPAEEDTADNGSEDESDNDNS